MPKRPSKTQRDPSATESGDAEPLLSRWARRKRLARSGADPDAAPEASSPEQKPLAETALVDAEATPPVAEEPAPEPTDEDMPALDSIDYRVGTYSRMREHMLALLNENTVLKDWTHRGADDPGIALLEGNAIVGDTIVEHPGSRDEPIVAMRA